MAANTMTMEHENHIGFFGRSIVRLTIAALMAVLVLGAASEIASAKAVTTTLGQNEFVRACRAGGGTTKRLGTHVVQCTTGSGEVVTCDFNTTPATCIIPFTPQQSDPMAPVTGGIFEQVDAEPSGPVVRPGQVGGVSGGVFEQVDPAPAPPDTTVTTGGTFEVVDVVATEEPAPAPAPGGQAAPATSEVVAAEPVVVEFVEDEQA